jgi:predicted metalloenzyme YecM
MFEELRQKLPAFLDEVFTYIAKLHLDVSGLPIDHIALRYKNKADVDALAAELKKQGTIISDAMIKNRVIYIFKLHQPLIYKNYQIPCIELPYPATPHKYPQDGWEHVEFVLETDNPNNFEEVFNQKFPGQKYELHIPEVEGEQLLNPSIVFKKYPGLAIKFHPSSIEKVVKSSRKYTASKS